jgi:predicted amidohydrolase YtcJ
VRNTIPESKAGASRGILAMLILGILLAVFSGIASYASAQSASIQDLSLAAEPLPMVTIFTAKQIITLEPACPSAQAVAVVGGRILAVGTLQELKAAAGKQPYVVDTSFADKVVVPGFIAQHDHPFLTALTMQAEIIAIEDWVLPSGIVPAAKNREEYLQRLIAAEKKLTDPKEPLLTWGFHQYFHGKLTRADLDKISSTRPIIVWHRSAHELIVNTPALETFGVTKEYLARQSKSAQEQSNLEEGHFWEQGLFGVVGNFGPAMATPERVQAGLKFMVDYFHTNGITLGCEPGGLLSKRMQDAENAVLSNRSNPFRFYFIPDGKSLIAAHPDNVIAETEKLMNWGEGMTAFLPKQVKLFADGAIYSQAMQTREPYTDGHVGAWMMDLDVFAKAFRVYWEAGYQIHVHVNGDAGLDMVLDNLESNMRRHPRYDHRTVIAHFALSTKEQASRIKRLGAIVSGNPYYITALADNYSKTGLGPQRADEMVRLGDVERVGVSYSFHSDMPMAPAQPLFLMHCAVNRTTMSGRIAGPDQCVSRSGALKAVTLDAAYSLRLENEVGSITPGKLANFTILSEDPVTCDASKIKDILVWGTVNEGRVLPVKQAQMGPVSVRMPENLRDLPPIPATHQPAGDEHDHGAGCACTIGQRIAECFDKGAER